MRAHRLLAAVATALLLATLLPTNASAQRRVESWQVGQGDVVTLTGNGFGHGRGMSQYGAKGAAEQGRTWREIVGFYYPGTAWGRAAGRVRVLITADTTRDVQVVSRPRISVRNLANGRTWLLPERRAVKWRLLPYGARTRVQFRRSSGTWRTWRTTSGEAQFSSKGGPLTLVLPGGSRASYRGMLRSAAAGPGKPRQTVNVVGLEAYLRGVVPREVPALWHTQAVSAQSVAARTYAAFERKQPAARHYDLCDTTQCQVYLGVDAEHPASDAAIKRTAGQVVTYGGNPAFTQFSASNGGWSVAGSMPYLVAQADPYDSAYRGWTQRLSRTAIQRHWPAIGDLTTIEIHRRDGNGEWGGRVVEMVLVGTKGRTTVHGETFRSYLGLRSSLFTVAVSARPVPQPAA